MLFLASFKLVLMCCSCLHHLLPWVASCSLSCIMLVVHHAMFMCCVLTMLFPSFLLCSFSIIPVSLRSWGSVRLCWFLYFMDLSSSWRDFRQDGRHHGSHYSLCYASCLDAIAMSRYLPLVFQASQIAMKPSNLFTLPSKPLFGYVTTLLSPSYSVASCRCSCRLFHVGTWISWDITISLI